MSKFDFLEAETKMNQKKQEILDPSAAMQTVLKEEKESDRTRRRDEAEASVNAAEYRRWRILWQELECAIASYLTGESSREMVDSILKLDPLLTALGFDGSLQQLRDSGADPEMRSQRDLIQVAICKMVADIWINLRFFDVDPIDLVAILDANEFREPIDHAAFVRLFIECGGLGMCDLCGEPKPPADRERSCCETCRRKEKKSLRWMYIAIECEMKHVGVNSWGVESQYPQWRRWKLRLMNVVEDVNASDRRLWQAWVDFVWREHQITEEELWGVQVADAERLLPPAEKQESSRTTPTRCPKAKKPAKVRDIKSKKLLPYLKAARLHFRWIEQGKPTSRKLERFLENEGYYDGIRNWQTLRSTARRTALLYGFEVARFKDWINALEAEVDRRQTAGIMLTDDDD